MLKDYSGCPCNAALLGWAPPLPTHCPPIAPPHASTQNVFRVYCLSDASREKELKVREVNAELDALAAAAREWGVLLLGRRMPCLLRCCAVCAVCLPLSKHR